MKLELQDIYTSYGLSKVLFGINLEVRLGECVALIGRNGVGKTTTLHSIMGFNPPNLGKIIWKGKDIVGTKPYKIAQMGIGLVPENREIFPNLTVWENMELGMRKEKNNNWKMDDMFSLFPGLINIQKRLGGYLSGGEQQMLSIARTLLGNPELILLDEPSEGLAPLIVRELIKKINDLRNNGVTFLSAEQNLVFCIETCSRVYILEKGMVVWNGLMENLKNSEEIKKKYLLL